MPVGFRKGRLDDSSRTDWDGNGPRPLNWCAWYPASDGADERAFLFGPAEQPWFDIGPVATDAPIASVPRHAPLVILSHGTGGHALHLGWLARRLAEHGFIVVGLDHHGNTLSEPYRAEGFLCWWERARDLSVLLDHLLDGAFGAHIDTRRIYVAGYSLGGCAAAALVGAITEQSRFQRSDASRDYARGVPEFPDLADHLQPLLETSAIFRTSWSGMSHSYRDPHFQAALMLAPGRGLLGFNEASLESINTPTRIIVGDTDPTLAAANWLHARLHSSSLDVMAPDVGHYVFLPEATDAGRRERPSICVDASGVNRRAVHDRIATAALDLFR